MNFKNYWTQLTESYPEESKNQLELVKQLCEKIWTDSRNNLIEENLTMKRTLINIAVPSQEIHDLEKKMADASRDQLKDVIMNDLQKARETLQAVGGGLD